MHVTVNRGSFSLKKTIYKKFRADSKKINMVADNGSLVAKAASCLPKDILALISDLYEGLVGSPLVRLLEKKYTEHMERTGWHCWECNRFTVNGLSEIAS